MQAVEQKQSQEVIGAENNFATNSAINCFQIRERLDALFGGAAPLEETPAGIRRILFGHLEICRTCCRSFDVRVRFRPTGRDRIY